VLGPGTVLIDVSEGTEVKLTTELLDKLGHPVLICHGPPHGTLCPLLRDGSCDILDQAHGVIFEFDLDRPQHRAILKRYREILAEDIPIRVVIPAGQDQAYSELLRDIDVSVTELTVGDLDGFAAGVDAYDRIAPDPAE
jgi:hypothetical protein